MCGEGNSHWRRTFLLLLLPLLPLVQSDPRTRCATAQAKLRTQILATAATELEVRELCSPNEAPGFYAGACSDLVQELWTLRAKSALDDETIAELRRQLAALDVNRR